MKYSAVAVLLSIGFATSLAYNFWASPESVHQHNWVTPGSVSSINHQFELAYMNMLDRR